jgi:hypothetical protein
LKEIHVNGRRADETVLVFASVALLPLGSASSADAVSERSFFDLRSFVGLWQGIDPADGGSPLHHLLQGWNLPTPWH